MSFLNNETYKNFDKPVYEILCILYEKENLNEYEVPLFYETLPYTELYAEECFNTFLKKHIEIINGITYKEDLYKKIIKRIISEKAFDCIPDNLEEEYCERYKFNADFFINEFSIKRFCKNYIDYFYDAIFKHLATSYPLYEYWINHVSLNMLKNISLNKSIAQILVYHKSIVKCLRKYNLLNKFNLPIYNFILLGLCGTGLNHDEFLNLYYKSFKIYDKKLFEELQITDINRYFYNLLKIRNAEFEVPNELVPIYLMEDLK